MIDVRLRMMLLAVAAGAGAMRPVAASVPIAVALPAAGEPDEAGESLEARQIMTRMSVPVSVNGQGPFRFVVDSGADRSVIGRALATRLGLPSGRRLTLHGTVGSQAVETVKLASLRVGSGEIADVVAPALLERHIGAQGLLGIDALAGQRVTLDFERELMTVQSAGRAPPIDPDEIVVTARRRFGQLILAEARVDDDRIHAIVDTGAQVTLGNSALRARVFRGRRPPRAVPITLVGVTGQEMVAELMILPKLRIGGMTMYGVPVAFSDAPPFKLFGVERVPAMLLGTDLLRSFRRVMLDFRTRKVRFLLRERAGAIAG